VIDTDWHIEQQGIGGGSSEFSREAVLLPAQTNSTNSNYRPPTYVATVELNSV
jgi:hypothetical protein